MSLNKIYGYLTLIRFFLYHKYNKSNSSELNIEAHVAII